MSKLSEVPDGAWVGKDGMPWYRIVRLVFVRPREDGTGDEVGLVVQFQDGGIRGRIVPDQEVEVMPS